MTARPLAFDPGQFTIHAQWGPRSATVEEAGRLLSHILRLTADAEPRITVWFPVDNDDWGYSVTGLPERSGPLNALAAHLAEGQPPVVRLTMQTSDVERTGAPLTTLDVVVGAVEAYEPNLVTWTLLEAGERFMASPQGALSFMHALISVTDCDWATISSETIDRLQPIDPDAVTAGWATYVSYRLRPLLATPPNGVTASPMNRGTLFTLTSRPDDVDTSTVLQFNQWLHSVGG